MRSPAEIIEAADQQVAAALKHGMSVIDTVVVVAFDEVTDLISRYGEDRLGEPTKLVERGGKPIGMICFERMPDGVQIYAGLFSEYESEPWADQYLSKVISTLSSILQRIGDSGRLNWSATTPALH